jgi:hypothetical protein
MPSIYGASAQRAPTAKTERHIEAQNDTLEWIAVGHFWWWKSLSVCN